MMNWVPEEGRKCMMTRLAAGVEMTVMIREGWVV